MTRILMSICFIVLGLAALTALQNDDGLIALGFAVMATCALFVIANVGKE